MTTQTYNYIDLNSNRKQLIARLREEGYTKLSRAHKDELIALAKKVNALIATEQDEEEARLAAEEQTAEKTEYTLEEAMAEEIARVEPEGVQHPNTTPRNSSTFYQSMHESMKLDRRIVCLETGEEFANGNRVYRAGYVSASEGDRLTARLYGARKQGWYVIFEAQDTRHYALAEGVEAGVLSDWAEWDVQDDYAYAD